MFDNNENTFSWESIGNTIIGRKNLGEDMPVFVYRMLQFSLRAELSKRIGDEETIEVFKSAGAKAGIEFANNMLDLTLPFNEFVSSLQETLQKNRIGILRIENFDTDTGKALLTIDEDLDCSGLPITGDTVCNYDEGFLAGVLKAYTKKDYIVTEIDCWATGARACRFEAVVKE
ncbi:MAG: V4R domain-containing protein [Clostridia bacterium]